MSVMLKYTKSGSRIVAERQVEYILKDRYALSKGKFRTNQILTELINKKNADCNIKTRRYCSSLPSIFSLHFVHNLAYGTI